MKLIHCADLHLDSKMTSNLTKEKAKIRRDELLETFKRMISYAQTEGVEAIIIAGDLFDTKKVSATARNVVKNEIEAHPEIYFYYLQGNHDEGSFVSSYQELPQNLFLFGEQWKSYALGDQLVLTGVELSEDNAESVYHELSLDVSKINIVTLHGQEAEYKAKDKAEVIHLAALKNKGIDYLALGHVHAYGKERLDARGTYCYPGCLEGRGFDECGTCGFVLLTIDEEQKRVETEFIPFAKRTLYTVPVDVSECNSTAEIMNCVQDALREQAIDSQNLVKVELQGPFDAQGEKDINLILRDFENDYFFAKIKDSTYYKVDYSQYEKDVSLKGEFIRTVMAAENLSEEQKATIIHYGIQALTGEEIGES